MGYGERNEMKDAGREGGGAAGGGIYDENSKRGEQDAVPRGSSDAEA